MTHGCGTISSGGGGGGFSGGGFSAATVAGAYHSTRRSRNNRNNNDDSLECCCALCWLIGFLFCLTKMTPKTRIVLTWVWVGAAAVTSGILVANNYFGDQSLSDSPWDMRQIQRLSQSFCADVRIQSSSGIDAYLLPDFPPISAGPPRHNQLKVSSYISSNSYEYWGFYFIKGSSIQLRVRGVNSMFDFYVIKGKSNLNKWIDDSDCSDCYQSMTTILIGTYGYTTSFTFGETDQYYFLFANKYEYSMGNFIDVDFNLTRKYYDVKTGVQQCFKSRNCDVDLDIGSSSTIIIDVPRDSPNDIDVTVTCNPRVYLYVLVFGMVPAFVGICISLGIYKYSKHKTTRRVTSTRRESQVFIVGREGEELSRVNEGPKPPSYVDNPPSYEECTSRK